MIIGIYNQKGKLIRRMEISLKGIKILKTFPEIVIKELKPKPV
jgi:hypothetical protein